VIQPKALLCIDAGNTLLKWCIHSNSELPLLQVQDWSTHPTGNLKPFSLCAEPVLNLLGPVLASQDFQAVLLSNVLGLEFEHAMHLLCKRYGVQLYLPRVNAHRGLHTAYQQPASLGKDRWLACLAVSELSQFAVNLVVGLGTATTFDSLVKTHDWQHLGGFIVPGVGAMFECLHVKTAELPFQGGHFVSPVLEKEEWPLNTQSAISDGVVRMQIAMVQATLADLSRWQGQPVQLWLCGGYAHDLAVYFPQACCLEHAVFKGLVFDYQLYLQGKA
jgi:type III pantothenate kinase